METGVTLFLEEKFQRGLAWDQFRGDIADPCGVIADFIVVIANPCVSRRDYCLMLSLRLYPRGVSSDIGNWGVGITPQMCNRVTNHGDMGIFSRP